MLDQIQDRGPELAKTIRGLRPRVRLVFMSGYTNEAIGRQGVLDPDVNFVQKPFTSDALLRSVRAAIDGPAAAE